MTLVDKLFNDILFSYFIFLSYWIVINFTPKKVCNLIGQKGYWRYDSLQCTSVLSGMLHSNIINIVFCNKKVKQK